MYHKELDETIAHVATFNCSRGGGVLGRSLGFYDTGGERDPGFFGLAHSEMVGEGGGLHAVSQTQSGLFSRFVFLWALS